MLRKIVGRGHTSSVHDDRQANKTAESELMLEFTKLNGQSPPASPMDGLKTGMKYEFQRELRTRRTSRETPENGMRYAVVWQRARAKLKSRLMINKLRRDLNLYGSDLTARSNVSMRDENPFERVLHKCLLPPKSHFLDLWQLILSISILYTAIVFPFRMAFYARSDSTFTILDFLVDIIFVLDVCVNLNLAYFDSNFELITSRKRIFKHYLKRWFVFDVLSCLPIATSDLWFGMEADQGQYSDLLRLLRLPRLYRLAKIIHILDTASPSRQNGLLEKCKDVLKMNHGGVKLLTTVMMIGIAIHVAACFWFFAARGSGFGPETWIVRIGQVDSPVSTQYLASVYWAVTTLATVGFGDINGYTNTERVLSVCWMFCGIYFFSFTIGSLTSFLSNIDTK